MKRADAVRRPRPWRTGEGPHWSREVRDANGHGFAWCGDANGAEDAAMIVRLGNADARAHVPAPRSCKLHPRRKVKP